MRTAINLSTAIRDEVLRHQTDVFQARALLEAELTAEQAHFEDRVRRRRRTEDVHPSGDHDLRKTVEEQLFQADEDKQRMEQDQDLQRRYPLAFLSLNAEMTIDSCELLHLLKRNLAKLAKERMATAADLLMLRRSGEPPVQGSLLMSSQPKMQHREYGTEAAPSATASATVKVEGALPAATAEVMGMAPLPSCETADTKPQISVRISGFASQRDIRRLQDPLGAGAVFVPQKGHRRALLHSTRLKQWQPAPPPAEKGVEAEARPSAPPPPSQAEATSNCLPWLKVPATHAVVQATLAALDREHREHLRTSAARRAYLMEQRAQAAAHGEVTESALADASIPLSAIVAAEGTVAHLDAELAHLDADARRFATLYADRKSILAGMIAAQQPSKCPGAAAAPEQCSTAEAAEPSPRRVRLSRMPPTQLLGADGNAVRPIHRAGRRVDRRACEVLSLRNKPEDDNIKGYSSAWCAAAAEQYMWPHLLERGIGHSLSGYCDGAALLGCGLNSANAPLSQHRSIPTQLPIRCVTQGALAQTQNAPSQSATPLGVTIRACGVKGLLCVEGVGDFMAEEVELRPT